MADTSKRAVRDVGARAWRNFQTFARTPRFAGALGYVLAGLYRSAKGAKHG